MNFEAVKPIRNVSNEQMLPFVFRFFVFLLAEKFHSLRLESCIYFKKQMCFLLFFLHIHQKCVLISIVSHHNV